MLLAQNQRSQTHLHSRLSGMLVPAPSSRLSKAGGCYTPMPSSSDELAGITLAPGESSV